MFTESGISEENFNKLVKEGFSDFFSPVQGGKVTVTAGTRTLTVDMDTGEVKHAGGKIDGDNKKRPGLRNDEVPTVLQSGEYVVQRKAVNKIGTKELDKINRMHDGGLVGTASEMIGGAGSVIQAAAFKNALNMFKTTAALASMGQIRRLQESAAGLAGFGEILNYPIDAGKAGGMKPWDTGYQNGRIPLNALSPIVGGSYMWPSAAARFNQMSNKYKLQTGTPLTGSGYRTYEDQVKFWNLYISGKGNLAARPGTSNHGWGLAVDVKGASSYGGSIFKWLAENAKSFGFSNDVRGEPWHWTQKMHKGGIVGSNDVPAILEKGELVIPKDSYTFGNSGGGAVPTMARYDTGSTGGVTMPRYSTGNSGASFMPSMGGGGSWGGGGGSSYSSNASNAYSVTVNVNSTNASAHEIANQVHARINRMGRKSR